MDGNSAVFVFVVERKIRLDCDRRSEVAVDVTIIVEQDMWKQVQVVILLCEKMSKDVFLLGVKLLAASLTEGGPSQENVYRYLCIVALYHRSSTKQYLVLVLLPVVVLLFGIILFLSFSQI